MIMIRKLMGHWLAQIGNGKGPGDPHRSWVRILVDPGMGHDSPIRDVQNESKNMIFGHNLMEIQVIL